MSKRPALLLYPAALAGIAVVLFYAIRGQGESKDLLRNIRETIEHDATRSHATYRLLKKQRRVLSALSAYILSVSKRVEKTAS